MNEVVPIRPYRPSIVDHHDPIKGPPIPILALHNIWATAQNQDIHRFTQDVSARVRCCASLVHQAFAYLGTKEANSSHFNPTLGLMRHPLEAVQAGVPMAVTQEVAASPPAPSDSGRGGALHSFLWFSNTQIYKCRRRRL